jgi:hypothetical protein
MKRENGNVVMRVLRGDATREQARDTGMAMVLVLLVLWLFNPRDGIVIAAVAVHLLTMVTPQAFRPLAVLWFGLSHVLGLVVSSAILSLIFFAVVTPIGVLRRIMGADSLKLRAFKRGRTSVMTVRNHTFIGNDLEKPY